MHPYFRPQNYDPYYEKTSEGFGENTAALGAGLAGLAAGDIAQGAAAPYVRRGVDRFNGLGPIQKARGAVRDRFSRTPRAPKFRPLAYQAGRADGFLSRFDTATPVKGTRLGRYARKTGRGVSRGVGRFGRAAGRSAIPLAVAMGAMGLTHNLLGND